MNQIVVVISNCNYAQYVGSCIESVLNQTVPCDVIVVDDASTDDSWNEILKFKGRVAAVRLKENSGGNARGKNVGIAMSKNPYIACFDSDDVMTPNSLKFRMEAMVRARSKFSFGFLRKVRSDLSYEKMKAVLLAYEGELHACDIPDALMRSVVSLKASFFRENSTNVDKLVAIIGGTTVLASRKLYEQYGLFDEELKWKIDKEMWSRWLYNGNVPAICQKCIAFYRKHNSSVTAMSEKGAGKKDISAVNSMYTNKASERKKNINCANTLMLDSYRWNDFVKEIIS